MVGRHALCDHFLIRHFPHPIHRLIQRHFVAENRGDAPILETPDGNRLFPREFPQIFGEESADAFSLAEFPHEIACEIDQDEDSVLGLHGIPVKDVFPAVRADASEAVQSNSVFGVGIEDGESEIGEGGKRFELEAQAAR